MAEEEPAGTDDTPPAAQPEEMPALEGKTTLGEGPVESAILAYHSLSSIGAEIASLLRARNVKQVILLNPPDLAGFHDLRWIETRIEAIRKMLEAVKPEEQTKALVVAGVVAAIGAVS